VSRRIAALVTAVVVVLALGFGAATPGLAASNESPSPPALATLIGCTGGHAPGSPSIGRCPAIARSSTSALHNPSSRRFPVGLSGATWLLAVVAVASAVVALVALLTSRTAGGLAAARAPPVSLR
jgi:hypothetical protein